LLAELFKLYAIPTGQIAAGTWKTPAAAVVCAESENPKSFVLALIAVLPAEDPPPECESVSFVAVWYATLHFSSKVETEVAPADVTSYATAEGAIATTAAVAMIATFKDLVIRIVCLS
jgi:hypothetical protein